MRLGVFGVLLLINNQIRLLDFSESFLPLKVGECNIVDRSFIINEYLPANNGYFFYVGSLTTPACSKGVNMYIL